MKGAVGLLSTAEVNRLWEHQSSSKSTFLAARGFFVVVSGKATVWYSKEGLKPWGHLWTLDPLLTILSLTTTGQYLHWKIETCTSLVNHRGMSRRGGSGEREEYINEMDFAIDVCLCFECSRRLFYLNVLKPVCLSIFHALVAMVHK